MSRAAVARQSDIVRAVKAARSAGLAVVGVEVKPDGTIHVRTAPEEQAAARKREIVL